MQLTNYLLVTCSVQYLSITSGWQGTIITSICGFCYIFILLSRESDESAKKLA